MSSTYREASATARARECDDVRRRYDALLELALDLDMTRGKPCPAQLDLATDLLTCVGAAEVAAASVDVRNYGGLDGIIEAKELFAEYMEVELDEVLIGGNSSLNMMYDTIAEAWIHGLGGAPPWSTLERVRFLCPSPGYDRHFTVCESLGIEMIPIEMRDDGPDMNEVEKLAGDPTIKGMWCVPRYSNPTGITYSADTVERLANMPAESDFRIYWDNAYAVHHLTDDPAPLVNILHACKKSGNPNRPYLFGSTSKITFPGAGVAIMAASAENIGERKRPLLAQTIGPDKINQLRHARFFGDMDGIRAHMKRHAAIIRPKFDAVLASFDAELASTGVADISRPQGGYFFSLDSLEGTATRVVELSAKAGVKLTPAGSTYPYKRDPNDRNLRLAPTLPDLEEIKQAMEVICTAVRLACLEKLA